MHATHETLLLELVTEPGGQDVHRELRIVSEYVPASHPRQLDEPSVAA